MHEVSLSLEDADNKQSNFGTEISNFDKGKKAIQNKLFSNHLGLFFRAKVFKFFREKVLNNFKSRLFPTKNI